MKLLLQHIGVILLVYASLLSFTTKGENPIVETETIHANKQDKNKENLKKEEEKTSLRGAKTV